MSKERVIAPQMHLDCGIENGRCYIHQCSIVNVESQQCMSKLYYAADKEVERLKADKKEWCVVFHDWAWQKEGYTSTEVAYDDWLRQGCPKAGGEG